MARFLYADILEGTHCAYSLQNVTQPRRGVPPIGNGALDDEGVYDGNAFAFCVDDDRIKID